MQQKVYTSILFSVTVSTDFVFSLLQNSVIKSVIPNVSFYGVLACQLLCEGYCRFLLLKVCGLFVLVLLTDSKHLIWDSCARFSIK